MSERCTHLDEVSLQELSLVKWGNFGATTPYEIGRELLDAPPPRGMANPGRDSEARTCTGGVRGVDLRRERPYRKHGRREQREHDQGEAPSHQLRVARDSLDPLRHRWPRWLPVPRSASAMRDAGT